MRPVATAGLYVVFSMLVLTHGSNYGTMDSPLIHKIINDVQDCQVHIVFLRLSSHNFSPTSRYPPVTLKSMPSVTPYDILRPPRGETPYTKAYLKKVTTTFNIFRTRGLNCQLIIVYFNQQLGIQPELLGFWLGRNSHKFITHAPFDKPERYIRRNMAYVSVLYLPPANMTSMQNFRKEIYDIVHSRDENGYNIENFGVLFLPDNFTSVGVLCVKRQGTRPYYENLACQPGLTMEDLSNSKFPPKVMTLYPLQGNDMPGSVVTAASNEELRRQNPFFSDSIHFYILSLILTMDNASLNNKVEFMGHRPSEIMITSFEASWTPRLGVGDIREFKSSDSAGKRIVTRVDGCNFLTAYSEVAISFHLYTKPFQLLVVIALFLTVNFLALILSTFQRFYKNQQSRFSWFFFMYATLVEKTTSVPTKTFEPSSVRLVIGLWLLQSIIFTSSYLGLIITEINSPWPSSLKLEDFYDLVCRKNNSIGWSKASEFFDKHYFPSKFYSLDETYRQYPDSFYKNNCFSLLSKPRLDYLDTNHFFSVPVNARHAENYEFFTLLLDMSWDRRFSESVDEPTEHVYMLLHPMHRFYPIGVPQIHIQKLPVRIEYLIEDEIVLGKKTAFVATSHQVQQEQDYLKRRYPHLRSKLRMGKAQLFLRHFGWIVDSFGASKIPLYLRLLVESGIHSKLEEYSKIAYDQDRVIRSREKAAAIPILANYQMNMHGSISTVFVIWTFSLILAAFTLVVENLLERLLFTAK